MRNSSVTGEQLANSLQALGINFILGGKADGEALHQKPAELIAALAQSQEARLRLALIPLFLEHPEFAAYARPVAASLGARPRLMLQCYYSAAVWLKQKHRARLESLPGAKASLPDLFSRALGIARTDDPDLNLQLLAKRHQELGGEKVNWLGTYHHAAQIWLRGLEMQHVRNG